MHLRLELRGKRVLHAIVDAGRFTPGKSQQNTRPSDVERPKSLNFAVGSMPKGFPVETIARNCIGTHYYRDSALCFLLTLNLNSDMPRLDMHLERSPEFFPQARAHAGVSPNHPSKMTKEPPIIPFSNLGGVWALALGSCRLRVVRTQHPNLEST